MDETRNEYEVYPGKSPDVFLDEYFSGNRIRIEAFCKNERMSLDVFRRLAAEVVTEWGAIEKTHRDRQDALSHLINHIRIKHGKEQRNNAARRYGASAREDASPDARMAAIAQEILRQSSCQA